MGVAMPGVEANAVGQAGHVDQQTGTRRQIDDAPVDAVHRRPRRAGDGPIQTAEQTALGARYRGEHHGGAAAGATAVTDRAKPRQRLPDQLGRFVGVAEALRWRQVRGAMGEVHQNDIRPRGMKLRLGVEGQPVGAVEGQLYNIEQQAIARRRPNQGAADQFGRAVADDGQPQRPQRRQIGAGLAQAVDRPPQTFKLVGIEAMVGQGADGPAHRHAGIGRDRLAAVAEVVWRRNQPG